MPDGSYNNIGDPDMGKAGHPYARSVQQKHALPQNMLPDAGLVFDILLKREKVQDTIHLVFLSYG
jgi:linoleate 10R-lipoxygenase